MLLFLFLSRKCYDGRMKIRLDALMMARNLVSSRSQAENYIRLGKVKVRESADILHEAEARNFDEKYLEKVKKNEWKKIEKPGFFVRENAEIKLAVEEQFVSRAALKLQSVASALDVDFEGKTVLDIGSSTGGFTEFAIKNGAKKVYAVEVGTKQMSPILLGDAQTFAKIELHEKTDIRDFHPNESGAKIDLVLADVSFISLDEILPPTLENLRENLTMNAEFILMVKPQFQVNRAKDPKTYAEIAKNKGIVKNENQRREILKKFEAFAKNYFVILDKKDSDVKGAKGNTERFYKLRLLSKKNSKR